MSSSWPPASSGGDRAPVQRRRDPHPSRALPGAQDHRGVRLRPPAQPEARRDRPPVRTRLRRGQGQRRVPRAHRGPARPTWPSRLSIRACMAGHRVALCDGGPVGRPPRPRPTARAPPRRAHAALSHPLIVIDEVGYIPFEAEAANLFFQLVSSRYERASVIVTSNKPFGRWGEVFGDAVVAAAMIDRLVHHAEVVSLKGDSYRLKDRDLGRVPTDDDRYVDRQGGQFSTVERGSIFSRC